MLGSSTGVGRSAQPVPSAAGRSPALAAGCTCLHTPGAHIGAQPHSRSPARLTAACPPPSRRPRAARHRWQRRTLRPGRVARTRRPPAAPPQHMAVSRVVLRLQWWLRRLAATVFQLRWWRSFPHRIDPDRAVAAAAAVAAVVAVGVCTMRVLATPAPVRTQWGLVAAQGVGVAISTDPYIPKSAAQGLAGSCIQIGLGQSIGQQCRTPGHSRHRHWFHRSTSCSLESRNQVLRRRSSWLASSSPRHFVRKQVAIRQCPCGSFCSDHCR